MKIPPEFLDSVAFISIREGQFHRPIGTCFFLHKEDGNLIYLVTCRHVIKSALDKDEQLYIRYNRKDYKGTVHVEIPKDWNWYYHQDEGEDKVDLAVLPFQGEMEAEADFIAAALPIGFVLGESEQEFQTNRPPSIGDEVISLGLFENFPGHFKNHPIIRFGRIAMKADEKIPGVELWYGTSEYYLVECQAYPGISGAPVFAHKEIDGKDAFFLVGIMAGYYYEDETIEKRFTHYGISLMIPAKKLGNILFGETLMELAELKRKIDLMKNRSGRSAGLREDDT